jgi:hypothetical protein
MIFDKINKKSFCMTLSGIITLKAKALALGFTENKNYQLAYIQPFYLGISIKYGYSPLILRNEI